MQMLLGLRQGPEARAPLPPSAEVDGKNAASNAFASLESSWRFAASERTAITSFTPKR